MAEPSGVERPRAVYARILDGDTLWLAVTGVDGPACRLALRDPETGDLVPVPTEVTEADGALLSARFDLCADDSGLPPSGRVTLTVVVVEQGRGEPLQVWSAPIPTDGPTRTPPSRDGRWQFRLQSLEGALRVVREPRPPCCEAFGFARTETTLDFRVSVPAEVEATLLVMTSEDAVLSTVALVADGEGFSASLDDHLLSGPAGVIAPLGVGSAERWLPVHRARNGLRAPNSAVAMPALPDTRVRDASPLRLRFLPGGRLALTRPVEDDRANG